MGLVELPNRYKFLLQFMFILVINFTFTFIFLAFQNLIFTSLELTSTEDKPCQLVEMEKNLDDDNSTGKIFSEMVVNEDKEKSNRCNQCDYACSDPSALRTHLKFTLEKNRTNATCVSMHPFRQAL